MAARFNEILRRGEKSFQNPARGYGGRARTGLQRMLKRSMSIGEEYSLRLIKGSMKKLMFRFRRKTVLEARGNKPKQRPDGRKEVDSWTALCGSDFPARQRRVEGGLQRTRPGDQDAQEENIWKIKRKWKIGEYRSQHEAIAYPGQN